MTTDADTIYQLLESEVDFDGDGFEVVLERVPFDPGRGAVSRFQFVDPDFDPQDSTTSITLETVLDGDESSREAHPVMFSGDGLYRRLKLYIRRLGRHLTPTWRASTGGGTLSDIVDDVGDNIVDDNANNIVAPGVDYKGFRLLGQTFGFQRTGSTRR